MNRWHTILFFQKQISLVNNRLLTIQHDFQPSKETTCHARQAHGVALPTLTNRALPNVFEWDDGEILSIEAPS